MINGDKRLVLACYITFNSTPPPWCANAIHVPLYPSVLDRPPCSVSDDHNVTRKVLRKNILAVYLAMHFNNYYKY